jgi:hypothetical protein
MRRRRVLPPGVWAYASPYRVGDVQALLALITGTTSLFYGLIPVSA